MTRRLVSAFARRLGVDGKRVHAAGKFRRQRGINHAVPVDPALSAEGLRHNINAVVRFTFGPMAGVALVLLGFVHHIQTFGRESLGQLSCDYIFRSHDAVGSAIWPFVKT